MRCHIAVALQVLSALLLALGSARSQESTPPRAETFDARQILRESADACRLVRTVEYEEEQEPAAEGGDHKHDVRATVRQARAPVPLGGFLPGKFAVDGSSSHPGGAPQRFAFTYDGKTLRLLDTSEKVVRVVRSPSPYVAGGLLGPAGMTGLRQFTEEQPFKDALERGEAVTREGTVKIDGVDCHVIAVTSTVEHPAFGKKSVVTRWFIGMGDKLPRGAEIGGNRKTLRNLRVNAPLPDSAFAFLPPSGYGEMLVTGAEPKRKGLLAVGTSAPDWKLPDPQGRIHALADYRGKVVLMDFWGTWCVPCRATMPGIQSIHERFKGRGVAVLGVTVGGDEAGDPVAYMKSYGFTYGLLLKGDEVAVSYNVGVLPSLYLIGEDGVIIHAEYGYREGAKDELIRMIDKYLEARRR